MDTDNAPAQPKASTSTAHTAIVNDQRSSDLSIALHPLPLLSVSEHFTRTCLQSGKNDVRVVGALIGTQAGREIEITNSFELSLSAGLVVDHGLFVTKRDQFKQVFPTYELLGWYSVGQQPTADDLTIHQQLLAYNENPLFLQLSPESLSTAKDLPVAVYEAVTEIVDKTPRTFFIRAPYKVETGEAERIAVDHTSKPSGSSAGGDSPVVANLMSQRNALKMLQDRVRYIVAYLEQVSQGTAQRDPGTLRQIASLASSLPAAHSPEFKDEFHTEYTDTLLTTYLSTLTKELVPLNELVDRFMLQYSGDRDRPQGSRPRRAPRDHSF